MPRLHELVENNDSKAMWEALKTATPDEVNERDDDGDTPLQLAILKQNSYMAFMLIHEGNADIKTDEAVNLYNCVGHGMDDVLIAMVNKGADVNALLGKDDGGDSAFHLVCALDNPKLFFFMIREGGADIELKDSKGNTPLHHAIDSNAYDMAQTLISCGADVDAVKDPHRLIGLSRSDVSRRFDYLSEKFTA